MLAKVRQMVIRAAETKQHRLSHLAILPDHLHLLLGIRLEESPLSVGLSYLNNIAYVYGMQPILQHGFFVGTFGEYNLSAIQ